MSTPAVAYPLDWPARRERTPDYKRKPAKGAGTFVAGVKALAKQVGMMRVGRLARPASNIVVTANVRLKSNGQPYAGGTNPDDPGVSVRFRVGDLWYALSCDRWATPAGNLAALAKVVEHLRAVARHGNAGDFEAVLYAFTIVAPTPQPPKPPPAPPEPPFGRSWRQSWEEYQAAGRHRQQPPPPPRPPQPPPRPHGAAWYAVLGVTLPCSRSDVDRAYRLLALQHHPDRGGDVAAMQRVNDAYAEFRRLYPDRP